MRKGEIEINTLVMWIIAIVVLLVILVYYTGLGAKMTGLLEALGSIFGG